MSRDYLDYAVMKHMGWSYFELLECPNPVFGNIVRYMNTENEFYRQHAKES